MKVLVTGATGFLGQHVVRLLKDRGIEPLQTSLSMGLDLRNKEKTLSFFKSNRPDFVINCAAFVGGIQFGYKFPAELFSRNMEMSVSLLDACKELGVRRLINPISNCAYPAKASFFKESEFWDGALHESVLSYGFARKALWVGAWSYQKQYGLDSINLILPNMYGPGDHFDEERSHALGALIKRIFHAEKSKQAQVVVWGTGTPVREWLYVEDGAESLIRALDIPSTIEPINIGSGYGVSIAELADKIKKAIGYSGMISFDPEKPDGAAHKTMDGSKGAQILDWIPKMGLDEGIQRTVESYVQNLSRL